MDDADDLISSSCGANGIPPVGSCHIGPSSTSSYTEELDDYNNGNAGVQHCGGLISLQDETWGVVKSHYRDTITQR